MEKSQRTETPKKEELGSDLSQKSPKPDQDISSSDSSDESGGEEDHHPAPVIPAKRRNAVIHTFSRPAFETMLQGINHHSTSKSTKAEQKQL